MLFVENSPKCEKMHNKVKKKSKHEEDKKFFEVQLVFEFF